MKKTSMEMKKTKHKKQTSALSNLNPILTFSFLLIVILTDIVLISSLTINSVLIEPKNISQDDIANIEIGIKNNGENDVNDISVALDLQELPFAPFESTSEYGIAEIKPGKIKFAKFKIIALNNAKPQVYKIPIKLSYSEENNSQIVTKTSLISLEVISKPIIGINIEENLLLKGESNEIFIKVINKGLGDVKFLEIEAVESASIDVLSSKKVYIGELDSDDFDTVGFKVFLKNNIPDKMNFPLIIKYNSLNKKYLEAINIPLEVYTKEKALEFGLIKKNYYLEIFLLILLLILAFILYRISSKRKHQILNT